ncbi:hypothetical protein [Actinomadura sp. KC06]|nr:hypothetical protein [Actinomadura sp. KC06]
MSTTAQIRNSVSRSIIASNVSFSGDSNWDGDFLADFDFRREL